MGLVLHGAEIVPKRQVSPADVQTLNTLIRGQLPPGWTVSFEVQNSQITIRRTKKVIGRWSGLSSSTFQAMIAEDYFLKLRVEPLVTISDYGRFCLENEETDAKIEEFQKVLSKIPTVRHGKGYFYAAGEPGKTEVLKYNRLLASRHELPDFYFRT